MRRGSSVLLIVVLAVLIVVNAALLFLLFQPDRILTAPPSDQDSGDGGSPTTISSPAAGASTNLESVPVERLLFAVSSKTAWRATVGDCDTPGMIERSTNGGASWKRIVRSGLAPIVRLGAEPSGDLLAIGGTGQSCSVRYLAYSNDGRVTKSTTSPLNLWFPSPQDRDEINGPDGTKATPCSGDHVIGLASLNVSRALVVCDNGAAMSTRNSGKVWRHAARIPNTLAIAAGSGRYWAAGVREDCDGVTLQSLTEENGSLTGGQTRCAPGLDVASGKVAMDVTDRTIWLWSGNRVAISTDNGETWK
jgi:hypothetical protein